MATVDLQHFITLWNY